MAVLVGLSVASPLGAQSAYDAIVAPIFRARCVSCHGEQKQKGKLALHAWERVAQGGDSGPLWVAGRPAESELVRRLRLPLDDEEHMPPADEPQLTKEEVALLVRWIERGASDTAAIAELGLSEDLARAVAELPERLRATKTTSDGAGARVVASDPAKVAAARAPLAAKVAELQHTFPGALTYESRGSAEMHFTAAGFGGTFGDVELAALAPLAPALVVLDLSRTAITDRSAPVLAGFTQLRVLRLGFTAVGDETGRRLGAMGNLEVLALPGTDVTEASVAAWRALGALRKLHLGETKAAAAAVVAQLPVIDAGMDMFVAEAPAGAPDPAATK